MAVIITDAEAHGYCSLAERDDFKSGRCPDQRDADYPSLETASIKLSRDLAVDTFFCRVNSGLLKTESLFAKVTIH